MSKKTNKQYYQERKTMAIDEAIEWQRTAATEPMSWGEVASWCNYFYKLAKRYGLIKEFKENGII